MYVMQLRKASASAKEVTSGASSLVNAELERAVVRAREEAATEAERAAARKIAEVRSCDVM